MHRVAFGGKSSNEFMIKPPDLAKRSALGRPIQWGESLQIATANVEVDPCPESFLTKDTFQTDQLPGTPTVTGTIDFEIECRGGRERELDKGRWKETEFRKMKA